MEYLFAGLPLPLRITPPYPMSDEALMRFSREHKLYPMEREANGDLLIMSPTGYEGSGLNAEVVFELELWNRQTGNTGGVTESNGGYTLPDGSVRAPDAAWTANALLDRLTPAERRGYAPICPQFIVELRSASDRLTDVERKMEMWMANGAELAWLIDPLDKAVTIYRQGRSAERLQDIAQVAGEGPVAGFVLPLDRIFR